MDTQTIEASVASAREGLMGSIKGQTDWSGFKDNSSNSTSSSAEPTLNSPNQSGDRSSSDASESQPNEQSQPIEEGTTKQSEVATNQTDTKQGQAKPSRENQRVRELVEKEKAALAKVAELERKLQQTSQTKQEPSKPQEPEALIPKPQFSDEYLNAELAKYEQAEADAILAQDKQALLTARQYMRGIQKLLNENAAWNAKNADAIKDYNGKVNYFREEAIKKWEALKDPNSPHTKEYIGLRGWIQQNVPEVLKNPVSEFLLAQIADWKLNSGTSSARLVATETELKKAKEEIEKLKKGSLPITSSSKVEKGSNDSPESTIREAKSGLMDSIRLSNTRMTM